MRALPAIVVIAILIAAAVFVADRPGDVSIVWQGWRVDTSVAVMLLGIIVLAFVVGLLWRLFRGVVSGPRAFWRRRRERRRRAGYRALTQGMVAVAAGDPDKAQRYARKADVLLADPPLTLLLSAQAAQLNGDETAARKYFQAMLKNPETEFLGLRGLINHALKRGDDATALRLAERARELEPKTPWVLTTLFELQARRGLWTEARQTLGEAQRRRALPAPELRRHEAAVLHELSLAAEREGRPRDALASAQKAQAADPASTAAVVRYAQLLQRDGKSRQAAKVLEQAWRVQPQPRLAEVYGALEAGEAPVARYKRLQRLAGASPDHLESHIALAAAALAAQLWGEARRHLDEAGAHAEPSARVCRLMAELEEAEHGDGAAARAWLARAAEAAPDPAYVCRACNTQARDWSALCPSCGGFDTLHWSTPTVVAAPVLMPPAPAETGERLPAPVEAAGAKPTPAAPAAEPATAAST